MALGPVLLLHLGLLIAFLHMNRSSFHESNASEHEIIFLLKPTPTVPNWQGDLLPSFNNTAIAIPRLVLPQVREYKATVINPEDVTSELQGVSRALFKCWPGSLVGYTLVQEAQCLALAPHQLPYFLEPPERSQNAAEWLRDRDRRNAPLRLPCTYGLSTATVVCVAVGLVNGFDLENGPSYVEDDSHTSGIDTIRHETQTVDPCALDKTYGFGFVYLYRVLNGNTPP
ncbi:MAG TPA: hypothetical protein VHX61_11020 [Rhizomicrobium sp.]|nr:hypothetical protein [Rhizomicrobium sp.]